MSPFGSRCAAILGLILAFAGAVSAQTPPPVSRVPDEFWPKWSPAVPCGWLSPGYQTPDPDGNFHALWEATEIVHAPGGDYVDRRLVHMTQDFGTRDGSGNSDPRRAEVLWTMPAGTIGRIFDGKCVTGRDGTIYAFFRAEVESDFDGFPTLYPFPSFGTLNDSLTVGCPNLYFLKKPWGGAWTAPVRVTTYDIPSVDPDGLLAHAKLGVLAYAVSIPDPTEAVPSPEPVCYLERAKVSWKYLPPGTTGGGTSGAWTVEQVSSALQSTAGVSASDVSSTDNDLFPTFTNSFTVFQGLGSHKGRYVRFVRPYPATAETPKQVIAGTGEGTIVASDLALGCDAPALALYVDSAGADHVLYRIGSFRKHNGSNLDATAMVEDANHVLHAFGDLHRIFQDGVWSPGTGTYSPAPSCSLAVDDLDRMYCASYSLGVRDFLGSYPSLTWTWEDNLGPQDGLAMMGLAPNTSANLSNGNLYSSIPFFACNGFGPSPSFGMSYNSLELNQGIAGAGWRHSWMLTATSTSQSSIPSMILTLPSGQRIVCYKVPGELRFQPLDQYGISLNIQASPASSGSGVVYFFNDMTIESMDGTKWTLNFDGKPKSLKDRDGNTLDFEYTDNPLTTNVKELNLTKIQDKYSRHADLEYDAQNRLKTVTDPATKTYSLIYDAASGKLTEIRFNGGPTIKWTFTYFNASGVPDTSELEAMHLGITSGPPPAGFPSPVEYTGIRGLLATIRTPHLNEGEPGTDADFRFSYRWNGPTPGRVYAAWDPMMTYVLPKASDPATDETVVKRFYATISYSTSIEDIGYEPGDPTTPLPPPPHPVRPYYRATYHDRERPTADWHVTCDFNRSIAVRTLDPLSRQTTRYFDMRRNVTVVESPGPDGSPLRTAYAYVTPGEFGLPVWALDLVRAVHLPGDPVDDADPDDILAGSAKSTLLEYDGDARKANKVTTVTGDVSSYTFDGEGHTLTSKEPAHTGTAVMTYFPDGQLHSLTDAGGRNTTFTYASYGLLETTVEHPGVDGGTITTRYAYTVMGQMDTSQTPGGAVTSYFYDGLHRLTKTTPPPATGSTLTSIEYTLNADGATTHVKGMNGFTNESQRDLLNRVTKVVTAEGQHSVTLYTPNGNVYKTTDFVPTTADPIASGRIQKVETDVVNRTKVLLSRIDAARFVESSWTYDAAGNVHTQSLAEPGFAGGGSVSLAQTTTFNFSATTGLPTETVLPGGDQKVKTFFNDRRELICQEVFGVHGTTETFMSGVFYARDVNGRVTDTIQESAPFVPPSTFGGSYAEPPGRKSHTGWNDSDMADSFRTPMGFTSAVLQDGAYRPFQSTDATDVKVFTDYTTDNLFKGNKRRIPGQMGLVATGENIYNGRRQIKEWKDALGTAVKNNIDAIGRLESTEGPAGTGMKVAAGYDKLDRRVSTTVSGEGGALFTTLTALNDQGLPSTATLPDGSDGIPEWGYVYTMGNLPKIVTTPLGNTSENEYDNLGRLTLRTDEDGNTTKYIFDIKNRLTEARYKHANGSDWETVKQEYDDAGRITAIEGSASLTRVEYQYALESDDTKTGEVRRVIWKLKATSASSFVPWKKLEYDYDDDGRRKETRVFDGADSYLSRKMNYFYDEAGRLKSIQLDSVTMARFNYEHGFLATTELPLAGTTIARDYDKKGRLKNLTHKKGSATLASIGYEYDLLDRRTAVHYKHLAIDSTFAYTPNSWLKHETHARVTSGPGGENEYATQDSGNASVPTDDLEVAPTTGGGAAVLFEAAYEYDGRGNRLTKTVLYGTTPTSTYGYDKEDRLTAESRGGVSISYGYAKRGDMTAKTVAGATTDYLTDHLGRITGVIASGTNWSYQYAPTGDRIAKFNNLISSENEWYLPDGGDTIADYHKSSGSEEFKGCYVSPGVDGRLARISETGAVTYYFGDALQSVHQVTDATGFEIRRQFTDAWGNEIAGVGFGTTGPGDRYGFQGRESDSESGLQHFRARSYDPMTGRFTSRDPVPHSNLYHFVENNPVNATDPSGLDSIIEEGTKVSWQFVKDGITVSIPLGSKQNNGNVKMFGGFARTNIDISELTGRARDTDAGKYADSYAAINIALGGHVEKAESADLAGWDKGVAVAGRAGARLEQAATGAVLSVGTGGVGGAAGGGYMFMRGVSGYLGEWDPSWDFVRLAYEKDLGEAAPYVDFTADVVSGAMAGGGLADEPPLNVLTPRPRSLKVTLPEAYGPPKPGQYSTAFEVQLKATDLGRSRSVHFGRSNEALEAAMDADPALARTMEDMIPGVRAAIGSVGGRATPSGWIWHHATRAEAQGRAGVMRLVPEAQHEPQSVFWRILHPDKGARGGYSEWAIPAGAPKN